MTQKHVYLTVYELDDIFNSQLYENWQNQSKTGLPDHAAKNGPTNDERANRPTNRHQTEDARDKKNPQ